MDLNEGAQWQQVTCRRCKRTGMLAGTVMGLLATAIVIAMAVLL